MSTATKSASRSTKRQDVSPQHPENPTWSTTNQEQKPSSGPGSGVPVGPRSYASITEDYKGAQNQPLDLTFGTWNECKYESGSATTEVCSTTNAAGPISDQYPFEFKVKLSPIRENEEDESGMEFCECPSSEAGPIKGEPRSPERNQDDDENHNFLDDSGEDKENIGENLEEDQVSTDFLPIRSPSSTAASAIARGSVGIGVCSGSGSTLPTPTEHDGMVVENGSSDDSNRLFIDTNFIEKDQPSPSVSSSNSESGLLSIEMQTSHSPKTIPEVLQPADDDDQSVIPPAPDVSQGQRQGQNSEANVDPMPNPNESSSHKAVAGSSGVTEKRKRRTVSEIGVSHLTHESTQTNPRRKTLALTLTERQEKEEERRAVALVAQFIKKEESLARWLAKRKQALEDKLAKLAAKRQARQNR